MTTSEALRTLRTAGFFIVAWTPDEMEGMDNEAREEMEDRLIMRGNDILDELRTDEDEDDTCPTCRGCGEGMYDGTSCSTCKGKGVLKPEVEWDGP